MHNISITDLHANFMFLFDQFHFLERTDDEHTNDRGRFTASVYSNHYETYRVMDTDLNHSVLTNGGFSVWKYACGFFSLAGVGFRI